MASRDLINLGIAPDSGTGDSARRGGAKINTLFADIYAHFGDNPVGNDPSGSNYGYRQRFGEYEYKVGELHPAGRYIPIKFKTSGTLSYDSTFGWGMNSSGNMVDTSGDGIPDIYQDSEWFFLARGDSLGLDLREIDSDKSAHLVLPLAVPGDVIRVRDTFDSWDGRFISVWTTPYEFDSENQISEWELETGYTYPDSDSLSISYFRNDKICVPFKRVISLDETSYPNLTQKFTTTSDTLYGSTPIPTGTSPVYYKNRPRYEIIFTYIGPRYGWAVQANALQSLDVTAEVNRLDNLIDGIDSDIAVARADLDSDSFHIQRIRTEADSDARSIAQLRRDLDSDSKALQNIRFEIDGGTY